jgi:hypothetical protein
MGKAFVDYLRLFRDPSLDPIERLRLTRYLLFHGLRPDVLWNLVVPGPNNYFGLDPGRIRADQSSSARDEASASEPRKIESVGV